MIVAIVGRVTESFRIDAGEVTLAYRAWGDPAARPLLLLHGLTSDSHSWDVIAPELAADWRVYAPDLRGHGLSERPGQYSFELVCRDVVGFLDALGVGRTVVIGHSMGGVAAYLFAHQNPGRVSALVLEEAPPPLPHSRPLPPRPDEDLAYDWAVREAIVGQVNAPDPRWWPLLKEITTPTLVIAGGLDSPFDSARIEAMAGEIPRGQFRLIPAGHSVHRTEPAEFLETTRAFLAAVAG